MPAAQDDSIEPTIRFKKRKLAHPKRVYTEEDAPTVSTSQAPDAATPPDALSPPGEASREEEESVPNLKEILRNRKRPRDRLKDSARKIETPTMDLVRSEPSRPEQYPSRFVAQTGQIVDRDDKQMTEYVEARLAEQNYRKYGWPIPAHLQASVAAIAPDLKHTFTAASSAPAVRAEADTPTNVEHSNRLATGQGKIEEVDLGPDATTRRREQPESKARRDKYGYSRRNPKRQNSEDMRRDQMVEAVLREAKLDYFDDSAPANSHLNSSGNNDDALAERFRLDYLESMEEARQQRKPAPAASGVKGVKEAPKGPKLGGSKSARAKILKAQEEEKKTAKR